MFASLHNLPTSPQSYFVRCVFHVKVIQSSLWSSRSGISFNESIYLEAFPKSIEVSDSNQYYYWLSYCDFTAHRPSDSSVYWGVHSSSEWRAWTLA